MSKGGINKVILVGHLGQDPDLKVVGDSKVVNFNLATNESWTDKEGNKHEKVEWHRMAAWGKTAELCKQILKKGSQAYFEGKLRTREWDDKETGKKRYATDINITMFQILSGGRGSESEGSGGARQPNDDVPF